MPKILDSMREQLLETARRQIAQNGYANTTIRSVAAECGIAVGTVYNYYPSKDMLIATFVSEDWHARMDPIAEYADEDAKTHLRRIYDALCAFIDDFRPLFSDADAAKAYHAALAQRHGQLRDQLAALSLPVCGNDPDCAFLSEFIAESLLTWTREGKPFDDIYQLIQRLIKEEREETKT